MAISCIAKSFEKAYYKRGMFKYVKDLIHIINAHDEIHILITCTYTCTCINHMQMNVYTTLFDTHATYSNLGLFTADQQAGQFICHIFLWPCRVSQANSI